MSLNELINPLGPPLPISVKTVTASSSVTTPILSASSSVTTPALAVTTSPTSGYVLTSDSKGNATWQAPSGGGGALQQASVTLNQSQIQGMFASPVEILAPDAGGRTYIVDSTYYSVSNIRGEFKAYTGGGFVFPQYTSPGIAAGDSVDASILTSVASELGYAGNTVGTWGNTIIGSGLSITNDTAPFASGGASMVATVNYYIVNITA